VNGFHHRNRDRGAALVEFALIMPLLLLLIFGMVDAGWAFFQNLEVRHGAREAARLAAVDYGTETQIIAKACERMSTASPDVTVALLLPGPDGVSGTGDDGATGIGNPAQATVTRQHDSLTGLLPFFDNITLSSTVQIRLEQEATWSPTSDDCAP
jgi:Flp pilus assembly protein TadG